MARDPDALKISKWAATGDVEDPEDGGIDRSIGWDISYSQPGGSLPKREHFNELDREVTALGVEVNVHGAGLEWDSSISYEHPALVTGSDARLYVSVQDSTNVDPVNDSDESHWSPLIDTTAGVISHPPNASATERGIVELATDAEVATGIDTTKAVTPAGLSSKPLPSASIAQPGIVQLATNTEVAAGTDTQRAVTPAGLASKPLPEATTTQRGVVELASQGEVNNGNSTKTVVTPATLEAKPLPSASIAQRGIVELATNTEVAAGTDTQRAVTPAGVRNLTATTTRHGVVELASNAEVATGTDATRAVTPAGLAALGYRRVTVSDSAPSSSDGSNGDVWLEY